MASVSETGLVTGLAVGTATITATSVADGTKTDTCAVTVTA
nr:Ig-like domain-containing protein [Pseudomonas asiatica]